MGEGVGAGRMGGCGKVGEREVRVAEFKCGEVWLDLGRCELRVGRCEWGGGR